MWTARSPFDVCTCAEIYLSQPGLGVVPGPRVLAEFGDDTPPARRRASPHELRRTSPITRQSGPNKTVLVRFVPNGRLIDALNRQAFAALCAPPGARPYYEQLGAAASATTPRSPCSAQGSIAGHTSTMVTQVPDVLCDAEAVPCPRRVLSGCDRGSTIGHRTVAPPQSGRLWSAAEPTHGSPVRPG
jgi:hypothetical protein